MLAALRDLGHSQRSASMATGLHQQTIARAIHGDPRAMSVGTLIGLLELGVPARVLAPELPALFRKTA